MIDVTKLPANVLRDVRQFVLDNRLVRPQSVGGNIAADAYIALCSTNEVFDMWLTWNGIINWAETIASAIDGIREADAGPFVGAKP